MKKYSTILFDADDTLLDFGKDETQALVKVLTTYGVPTTKELLFVVRVILLLGAGASPSVSPPQDTKANIPKARANNFISFITSYSLCRYRTSLERDCNSKVYTSIRRLLTADTARAYNTLTVTTV